MHSIYDICLTMLNGPNQPLKVHGNFHFEYMREIDNEVDPVEEFFSITPLYNIPIS
ncbi:MAG: hypothetical protein CM15mV5_0880 [uncultured marine virus]|nr:MAG: hypothetical protein CM15mV5_0880 [uncultured marine virus]